MLPVPPLSIVIPTTQPWPEVRRCLDSVATQARQHGAEVILACRGADGFPPASRPHYPGVRVVVVEGGATFDLRAAGFAACRGEWIALTEDHCVAARNWVESLLRASQENPEAQLVVGAVQNGSTRNTVDWANFLVSLRPFLPPLPRPLRFGDPPVGNTAFRRTLLPDKVLPGWFEESLGRAVPESRRAADGRAVVTHVQSGSWRPTLGYHFHNGRATALRGRRPGAALVGMFTTPPGLVWSTWRNLGPRGRRRLAARASPWIFVMGLVFAWGRLFGALAGPGSSPQRLR